MISLVAMTPFDHCVRFNTDADQLADPSSVLATKDMGSTSQFKLAIRHLKRLAPASHPYQKEGKSRKVCKIIPHYRSFMLTVLNYFLPFLRA